MKTIMKFKTFAFIMATFILVNIPLCAQAAESVDYSVVFDAGYYYNIYPDVREIIGNDEAALLEHFIAYGMKEGRRGNSSFDVRAYMNNNPDLIQAFGSEDLVSYYLHYISYGKAEGRTAVSENGNNYPTPNESVSQNTLISSYSTQYDPASARAVNIALAASNINGTVINPGEEFSFSNTVGPRTAQNGFVEATVFINRKEALGIGGGICQVSSTVYAAMLEGGIAATERHSHSLPVTYIPQGMDATIVAGQKDLRFTNRFDFPILINATADKGVVTVSFMGIKN